MILMILCIQSFNFINISTQQEESSETMRCFFEKLRLKLSPPPPPPLLLEYLHLSQFEIVKMHILAYSPGNIA